MTLMRSDLPSTSMLGGSSRRPRIGLRIAKEQGFSGFRARSWFGLFAPKGVRQEIVDKINSDVVAILTDRSISGEFLETQMMEPITGTPDAYAKLIRGDAERWKQVIEAAKIQIQ
jgi:tripartite-type tricarboxylate transporter receptor subunit TctC